MEGVGFTKEQIEKVKFTEEQVALIQDKVINKIILPHVVLKYLGEGKTVKGDFIELALKSLDELTEFVRSL